MLVELFQRGPSTVGIFRKSALMKSVKQLKQELDEGNIFYSALENSTLPLRSQ